MYRFTLTEARPSHTRTLVGAAVIVAALGAAALAVGCADRKRHTQDPVATGSASLPTTTSAAPDPAPAPQPAAPTPGHYAQAVTDWRAGDRDGAVQEFRAAIDEDSTKLPPRLNLSRVLLEQGKAGEASVEIQAVITLDSTSGAAFRLLGRARDLEGQTDSAVTAYQHAIVLNDQDGWAMNNLALVQIERGGYDEAIKALARAVEISGSATFRNSLGLALERSGRYQAAAEAYQAALAADSNYRKASVNLTRVKALTEVAGTQPVDLALSALEFMREIEGWRTPKS